MTNHKCDYCGKTSHIAFDQVCNDCNTASTPFEVPEDVRQAQEALAAKWAKEAEAAK
tara:strand:+ start:7064 stop:7234 length:171 start_codon:yes stop_codon:yes gene_type:complete